MQHHPPNRPACLFDLGTFEGFNFRSLCCIPRSLTGAEVVAWDHDRDGKSEFWPAGVVPGVAMLFNPRANPTAAELLHLDRLLHELGGDSLFNYLRIHYAVNLREVGLATLSRETLEYLPVGILIGTNFFDARYQAAHELFARDYPEDFRVWQKSLCHGLTFDPDAFLDSPGLEVAELYLGEQVAVLVTRVQAPPPRATSGRFGGRASCRTLPPGRAALEKRLPGPPCSRPDACGARPSRVARY